MRHWKIDGPDGETFAMTQDDQTPADAGYDPEVHAWTEIGAERPGDPDAVLGADGNWLLPLETRKARMREDVNELRDLHQNDVAMTPIGWVDIDERSKTKINGLVSMATLAKGAGQPFEVNFTAADNTRTPLDADGMIALGLAVGQHVMACHDFASALKEQIEAAIDDAALDAIDILENWP
jgi:hypothetical protein